MVGVVKSCCQHSLQDVHEPSPATVPSQASSPDKTASTRSRLSRHRRWEQSLPCCQFERRWVGAGETPPHTHTPAPTQPGSAPAGPVLPFKLQPERVLLSGHTSVPWMGLGQPELPGDSRTRWVGTGGEARAGCPCQGPRRTQWLCLSVHSVGGSPSLAPEGLCF